MVKVLFVLWSANVGVFTHVMMNVLDFNDKGHDVGLVFESESCKLIAEYEEKKNEKYDKIKENNLIASVCKVCAQAMNSLESAQRQNLPIDDALWGHTPLEQWAKKGFQIISC